MSLVAGNEPIMRAEPLISSKEDVPVVMTQRKKLAKAIAMTSKLTSLMQNTKLAGLSATVPYAMAPEKSLDPSF